MHKISVPAQSVVYLAEEIFDGMNKAINWRARHNEALGGQPPFMICGPEIGAKQIKRIFHALDWDKVV